MARPVVLIFSTGFIVVCIIFFPPPVSIRGLHSGLLHALYQVQHVFETFRSKVHSRDER